MRKKRIRAFSISLWAVFCSLASPLGWALPQDIYGQESPLQRGGSLSGLSFQDQTEVLTPRGIVDERHFKQVEPAAGEVEGDMPAIPMLDDVPVGESETELDPGQSYPDEAAPIDPAAPAEEEAVSAAPTGLPAPYGEDYRSENAAEPVLMEPNTDSGTTPILD